MNKNPFLPQPSYTPQQPPLPPGPPPPQPAQPDYTAYWAAAAAQQQQQQQQQHQQQQIQPPTVGAYNPQWSVPQPPRPPAEQSALYANYGYGNQQNNHWQRQNAQQQQHYQVPPPPIVQPPPPPPAQPAYNPYQPTAGYPQPYVPQAMPAVQPMNILYPHAPPPQPPQQHFFPQHLQPPQQQQQQPRNIHHTPPQHLPPAKRQRFDGPNHNQHNQNQQHRVPPPPQPQFQPPPPPGQGIGVFSGPPHGPSRGGPPGSNHMSMVGGGRGGGQGNGGRGGIGGGRGGRNGPMAGNRGGMNGRGGRGGSAFLGGGNNAGRGGAAPLRGHGSRGNFGNNKDYHNRRGGGSFTSGSGGGGGGSSYSHQGSSSFRGRGQGHANSGRGGRHDGGGGGTGVTFGTRDGTMSSNFSNTGKKEENRRTLTDFKIIGLEIRDLAWSWGTLPAPPPTKIEVKEEVLDTVVEDVTMEHDAVAKPAVENAEDAPKPEVDIGNSVDVESADATAAGDLTQPPSQESSVPVSGPRGGSPSKDSPPPSRIRIYFHTPASADDSRPIPHSNPYSLGATPSDSRKGKRKKLEDDDGDLEEGRAPPPPPQMGGGINDDRSSIAGSVAPSVAETASEGDWLMAAINEADGEGDHADIDEDEDGDQLHVSQIVEFNELDMSPVDGGADTDADGNIHDLDVMGAEPTTDDTAGAVSIEAGNPQDVPADAEGGALVAPNGLNSILPEPPLADQIAASASEAVVVEAKEVERASPAPDGLASAPAPDPARAENVSEAIDHPDASTSVSSTQNDAVASSASVEEQSANHIGYAETQVADTFVEGNSQEETSSSTLLDIDQEAGTSEHITLNGDGHHAEETKGDLDDATLEHLPEPPASPTSNTLLSTASSSTYSQGTSKAETKAGRIPSANRLSISYAGGNRRLVIDAEVVDHLTLFRQEGRIEVLIKLEKESDDLFKGIVIEGLSEVTRTYLPLEIMSELTESDSTLPPFAKATIPSTLMMLVHLDTARPLSEPKWAKSGDIPEWLRSMFGRMFWVAGDAAGWEKKIRVEDPDPPPTIWTVLEGWSANSPVGVSNERQRFLKTHMTEADNILEILLRLVRGERATPFSQSAPTISAPSVSGPLLSALSQGSAHGAQQTHVSLAVLAMFRMTVEYAKKAVGEKGKVEVEERVGEIIRCLPSHLIYKSLDGIFKEWRVDKKGR